MTRSFYANRLPRSLLRVIVRALPIALFFLALHLISLHELSDEVSKSRNLLAQLHKRVPYLPKAWQSDAGRFGEFKICPQCTCSTPNSYALSGFISAQPSSSRQKEYLVAREIESKVLLDSWAAPEFTPNNSIAGMYAGYLTCPDPVLALNISNLKFQLPTMYIYTRTGPGSKVGTKGRCQYLVNHANMIKEHLALVQQNGYRDGVSHEKRQLIWLVIEDDYTIDQDLLDTLKQTGLSYIYLAYGPTRKFGKAQWNVIMKTIETIRDGFYGDGPVYNLDDDSRVLPELYDRLWTLKRAVVWPVGNGYGDWEGPRTLNGKLAFWVGYLSGRRTFPIDLNGFAINSSEIGDGRSISRPKYIPWDWQAGENEFLLQIYSKRHQIEHLCADTLADKCYLVWHNWRKPWGRPGDHEWRPNVAPEWVNIKPEDPSTLPTWHPERPLDNKTRLYDTKEDAL